MKDPRSARLAEQHLAIAKTALWNLAGFAIHADEAPRVEDYDDTESAYGNGENVALWEDGMIALTALAAMDDPKAIEILEANRELEEARDAQESEEEESG